MSDLFLHKRPVQSVFSLIGENENDITFSLGWALSRSPGLLRNLLRTAPHLRNHYDPQQTVISLQESHQKGGITDIEIRSPTLHVIVEAKRGWSLPTATQLTGYCRRFQRAKATPARARATLSPIPGRHPLHAQIPLVRLRSRRSTLRPHPSRRRPHVANRPWTHAHRTLRAYASNS